jgi:MEMO1 family protein
MQTASVREPAVAGLFYPGDRHTLAAQVDELLAAAGGAASSLPPVRMMVAPHAGYTYSGATAARAFQRLRSSSSVPARAFIIGPSHVESFNFTSVFDGTAYRTPLGDVKVDVEAAQALARSHASIRCDQAGHTRSRGSHGGRGEHSIEVMLPFLQRVTPDVHIVPVIMGSQSWDACEALAGGIGSIVDWSRDVVVASSDLSHFYGDARARELDGVFCESLETLDASLLHGRLARGECEACGGGPVVASLIASESLRRRACSILSRTNSGDVSGDRTSVVGYVSAAVTGEPA